MSKFKKGHGFEFSPLEERECKSCGDIFKTNKPNRLYCDFCSNARKAYKKETFIRISNIRKNFVRLCQENPSKAIALRQEMMEEEGPEFTNMVLSNIIQNLLSNKEIKKKFKITEKYKYALNNYKGKEPKFYCPKCGKPYLKKIFYNRHVEECNGFDKLEIKLLKG